MSNGFPCVVLGVLAYAPIMALYLTSMYLASLALGYVLGFTKATLEIGRFLSNSDTPRGFQNAITPPRFSTLAMVVYIASVAGLIYGFWRFGWLAGLAVTVGFFVVVSLNKLLVLPKSHGQHFRRIIVRSMISRHADYLKSGDTLRAAAMGHLLEKLGVPVDEFIARVKRSGDGFN